MKKVYIARHIYPTDPYDSHITYDETVFSTYRKALFYINKQSTQYTKKDFKFYGEWYFEIVEYELDNPMAEEKCKIWYFDILGSTICDIDCSDVLEIDTSPQSFTGKFKVGDIVFVQSFPWNKDSRTLNIFGVIADTPIPFRDWQKQNGETENWENDYTIFFIDPNGFLDDTHIQEKGIEHYNGKLPKELKYLKLISTVVKNKKKFTAKLWREINEGKVIFRDTRVFRLSDFKKA